MSSNEEFRSLFILEMILEAKVSFVTRRGHVGGLEDYEERILDEFHELETSFDVLVTPCDVATNFLHKSDGEETGANRISPDPERTWVDEILRFMRPVGYGPTTFPLSYSDLCRNNLVYFSVVPRDGIFEIDLSNSNAIDSSMYAASNKRAKLNLDSALLWHYRLGHISKKRIEKL
ncbi:retrotransposon protein, putative, ty1-copia subclass [Tanacetum coccineum]